MKLLKQLVALLIVTAIDLINGNEQISLDFISDVVETTHGYPIFEYLLNTDIAEIICRGGKLSSVSEITDGISSCKASQSKDACRFICLMQHLKAIKSSTEDLGVVIKDADAMIDRIFPSKVQSDLKVVIRMCENKLGTVLDTEKGCEDNKKFVDCIQISLVQICDMRILPKPQQLMGKQALAG